MIGRIYLLKSSEAERRHTARWRSSETASPCRLRQNSAQKQQCTIWTLGGSAKYHSHVSVLLRKGTFKVFRFQSAPSQASFSVCPCSKRSFSPARIQNTPSSLYAPKAPSCSPESKAALRGCLNPRLPFTITRIQSHSYHLGSKDPPSCPPESKAPLVFAQILTRI